MATAREGGTRGFVPAGKLCHIVLSDECGQKIRVREIIASEGQLPPKPSSSFAKVVKPDQLCGYINYFGQELTPRAQDRIIAYLRKRC